MVLLVRWGLLNPVAANEACSFGDLQQDQRKVDKFVERCGITEALRPLSPVP